jgi:alkanesulfonate monooxygenase SsuD/methylene tetrahydromethanopterin reductase-like flavin-dependent oxidoreductase (luciferase family)
MQVGIGVPNTVPGTSAGALLEWARRAEEGPFTSIGVLHRVAYDAHDPLDVLAAAAPETERLRLVTMVVVAPLVETERLAERVATIQERSGRRLVLGVSTGARVEDYDAAGVDPRGRGRRLDEQLLSLPDLWEAAETPPPPVLVGGLADRAFSRMARWSDGYVHGGGPPRAFATAALRARAAWQDLGRPGEPRLWGQSYFVLGDEATVERGLAYMRDYYSFVGPFAERIVEGTLRTPQQIAQQVRGYAEEGCEELVLLPAVADLDQVDRLAEVLAG